MTITGGGPGLGMIAWVLAGIMTITAGLTAAEVSAAIPKTGGMMVYIEEIYGKKLRVFNWMDAICIILPCYNSCYISYVRATSCYIIR